MGFGIFFPCAFWEDSGGGGGGDVPAVAENNRQRRRKGKTKFWSLLFLPHPGHIPSLEANASSSSSSPCSKPPSLLSSVVALLCERCVYYPKNLREHSAEAPPSFLWFPLRRRCGSGSSSLLPFLFPPPPLCYIHFTAGENGITQEEKNRQTENRGR